MPPSLTQPTILRSLTTHALLSRVLASPSAAPATLVICSTRSAFLAHILATTTVSPSSHASDVLTPTLHTLGTSSRSRLVFCPSVAALLGWLAVYKGTQAREGKNEVSGVRMLYLLDLLALHENTASFSAQGLGRCFAAAVEAAGTAGERLVVVECAGKRSRERMSEAGDRVREAVEEEAVVGGRGDWEGEGDRDEGDGEGVDGEEAEEDPWEQEVPILNISMRRLRAENGERGWAGRTVKVSTVAERWFRFEAVKDEPEDEMGGMHED